MSAEEFFLNPPASVRRWYLKAWYMEDFGEWKFSHICDYDPIETREKLVEMIEDIAIGQGWKKRTDIIPPENIDIVFSDTNSSKVIFGYEMKCADYIESLGIWSR